jgi:hypothetical protein
MQHVRLSTRTRRRKSSVTLDEYLKGLEYAIENFDDDSDETIHHAIRLLREQRGDYTPLSFDAFRVFRRELR